MTNSNTIDRGPCVLRVYDDDFILFTPEHTFKDIAEWIFNEGGAEDVMYYLAELKEGSDG